MRFKTNARCGGCTAIITEALSALAPKENWTIDLQSPDKILCYTGNTPVDASAVQELVRGAGFKIEQLPD